MAILFYDHLISKADILAMIEQAEAADNQKGRILQLIDDVIYQGIIHFLLEKLDTTHHLHFLTQMHERPYDPELLAYLRDHINPNIEDEIRAEGHKITEQIIADLQPKD